ncbi:MAG: hypothetical protein NC489_29060 [Ruminococcus flavefaciens]|nr:hypothetical protein [Ruminococcus flavefaciens]
MNCIDDIFFMDKIFSIEQAVSREVGITITNVSHWDSSHKFQQHMSKSMLLPSSSLPWNYYYTYSILEEDRKKVLKKLGVQSQYLQSTMGLLLQSSTIAIVNMINLLINKNQKRLCILQPAYFSVEHCCSVFSLDYGFEQIVFSKNHPKIPIEKILNGRYDCVWITSPIFCTGYYYSKTQIEEIKILKSAGLTLIFDESLAIPGKELIKYFPVDNNIFAIYSPHKSISINGLKFSVIICNKCYEEFLEQWIDVFSGALSSSNRDAVLHYISKNFLTECFPSYLSYINKNKASILEIIKQFHFASTLPDSEGHYISLFTNLKMKDENELISLISFIIKNGFASFIPGELNGLLNSNYLNFRINLTGDSYELPSAIGRILKIIQKKYY